MKKRSDDIVSLIGQIILGLFVGMIIGIIVSPVLLVALKILEFFVNR